MLRYVRNEMEVSPRAEDDDLTPSQSIYEHFGAILPLLGPKCRPKLLLVPILTLYFDLSHPVS